MKTETVKKIGIPPESTGSLHISLWDDDFVQIENCSEVADIKNECIKIAYGHRIIAFNGENLEARELDGGNLSIIGRILSIEYLT